MTKTTLKTNLEAIDITYDYEKTFSELKNTVIDYMNETNDYTLDEYFNDYIDGETVEGIIKNDLNEGNGLARIGCFLTGVKLSNTDLFKLNGYGNLENITIEDLQNLKSELIDAIS